MFLNYLRVVLIALPAMASAVVDQSWCNTRCYPRSCQDVKTSTRASGQNNISGVYFIKPELAHEGFLAFCEMETHGGGWTTILNRFDGSINFFLNWTDYRYGFGHLSGEFWLGLEKLYFLTGSEVNELLVELEDWNNTTAFARYARFAIGSKAEKYSLKLIEYDFGDAGDSLTEHAGMKFSTADADYDNAPNLNCALNWSGAWWYHLCSASGLTEKYKTGALNELASRMYWGSFGGSLNSLKTVKMLVRPVNKNILYTPLPPTYPPLEPTCRFGY